MIKKVKRKLQRAIKRRIADRKLVLLTTIVVLCFSIITYTYYMDNRQLSIDPSSYTPILNLVSKVESKNNYNAYFGNSANQTIKFTDMSIAEVLKWQTEHIKQGNISSAVGRYQIIDTTLSGLVKKLGIEPSQKFDQPTQDQMAIALLEQRGAVAYINDDLTREELAANLAKEWAGLPKVIGDNPNDSYYASDGINKALATVEEVLTAIDQLKPVQ